MKLVQRANKQLRIPDDKLDHYKGLGYHEVKSEKVQAGKKSEKKSE